MDATLEFEQYLKNDYKLSVLQKIFKKDFLKYDPTLVKDITVSLLIVMRLAIYH